MRLPSHPHQAQTLRANRRPFCQRSKPRVPSEVVAKSNEVSTVPQSGSVTLPAVHRIACDPGVCNRGTNVVLRTCELASEHNALIFALSSGSPPRLSQVLWGAVPPRGTASGRCHRRRRPPSSSACVGRRASGTSARGAAASTPGTSGRRSTLPCCAR